MPPQTSQILNASSPPVRLGGKKADQAYDALKRAIILRQYEPRHQLREQTIAGEFQCSQSTVREALINLEKDGLVRRTGYHGTHVTETSLEEAMVFVRLRLTIERDVAARLNQRRETVDSKSVEPILIAMDAAHTSKDLFRNSELDREFHAQLAIMADMELLSPVLKRCALHIHRFTLSNLEVPRDFFQDSGSGEEHRQLFADLHAGSAQDAEKAVTQHLASVLQRWSPSLYAAVGVDQF